MGIRQFILSFLLLWSGLAAASGCPAFLQRALEVIGAVDFSDVEILGHATTPTVRIVGMREGQHGGKIYVVEKTGETWGSVASSNGFDPQGDPRAFIMIAGTKAAAFFGFAMIGDKQMTIPDVVEFNGASTKVNAYYRERGETAPIGIFFYAQKTQTLSGYLDSFMTQALLPMAIDGVGQIHDVSFHSGAIFFPESFVALAQEVYRLNDEFVKYILMRAGPLGPAVLNAAKAYLINFKLDRASNLDGASASATTGLTVFQNGASEEFADLYLEFVQKAAHAMFGEKPDYAQSLLAQLSKVTLRDERSFAPNKLSAAEWQRSVIDVLPPEQLIGWAQNFLGEQSKKISWIDSPFPVAPGDLCPGINANRIRVVTAAQKLAEGAR